MRYAWFLLTATIVAAPELSAQLTVTTAAPAGVTSYVANLKGSVNPNGLDTHVWFLLSPNSHMTGSIQTLEADVGSGTTVISFQSQVTGLSGNQTYYYQAYASNSAGTGHGSILSFTTTATPQVSISVTNSAGFTQGENGAAYTITVSNSANGGPTSASVFVTETIPDGLTMVSMSGPNWACDFGVCQRNDELAPGASYPPITVMVNVGVSAPSQVTNQVALTGTGLVPQSASDVTKIASLSSEQQFINATNTAISTESGSLGPATHPLVFSGNLVYATGSVIDSVRQSVLLDYVDGLKAAGVQRVDLNPGVTSINDPAATALYDAVVRHIRELGLQLAINPEVTVGELGKTPTFQDLQDAATVTYPQLAARYQPDNFVIVHLPTTMAARLGIAATVAQWDGLIRAVAPLIKTASPHTRLGAGGYDAESSYYQDFLGIQALDFLTMTIFDDNNFPEYVQWAQEAQASADPTHPNGKGVYIDETWAPFYLPAQLPSDWQVETLDSLALVGSCNSDFASLDANWLQLMSQFASANGMEAVTAYTTEAFFLYGTANADKPAETAYAASAQQSILQGQLTATAQAYVADSQKWGIKEATSISSASFATFPTVFNPTCGTGGNPCNANATVAPDTLVSAFGSDLAATVALTPSASFPTTLAGTSMTMVDSSNTTYNVGLYFASQQQLTYLVPSNAQPGPATISITSGDGTKTAGVVLISPVAPGIFTANQNGSGPPVGIAICAGSCAGWPNPLGNGQFSQYTFANGCAAGSCTPQTLSLGGSSDTVVIELFGTGIRHVSSLAAITATIAGQSVPVQYAGPQGQYPGLDQVNVQIPHSLAGSGEVTLVLNVQDPVNNVNTMSNTVTLNIL
jgi:uncharacterized protein (TIGR03437 family)